MKLKLSSARTRLFSVPLTLVALQGPIPIAVVAVADLFPTDTNNDKPKQITNKSPLFRFVNKKRSRAPPTDGTGHLISEGNNWFSKKPIVYN